MPATARVQPRPNAPEPRRRRNPTVRRNAPAHRRRASPRLRVAGGLAWIAFVAVLLAGIVAINVAALRLHLEIQRLEERKDKLRAENAAAASEVSTLAAAGRVELVARGSLGLVRPVETTYVRVQRRGR